MHEKLGKCFTDNKIDQNEIEILYKLNEESKITKRYWYIRILTNIPERIQLINKVLKENNFFLKL